MISNPLKYSSKKSEIVEYLMIYQDRKNEI